MNARLVRTTGSGFVKTGSVTGGHPVEFRHWQEVVEEAEAHLEAAAASEEEEAVVELWLEDPMSFQDAFDAEEAPRAKTSSLRRVQTHTDHKVASTRWDSDFAEAQAHAASVLKNLGNAR